MPCIPHSDTSGCGCNRKCSSQWENSSRGHRVGIIGPQWPGQLHFWWKVSIWSCFLYFCHLLATMHHLPSKASVFPFFLKPTQTLIMKIVKKLHMLSFFIWTRAGMPVCSGPITWPVRSLYFSLSCMMTYFIFSLLSPLAPLTSSSTSSTTTTIFFFCLHFFGVPAAFVSDSSGVLWVFAFFFFCFRHWESLSGDDTDLSNHAIAFGSVGCCFVPALDFGWLILTDEWVPGAEGIADVGVRHCMKNVACRYLSCWSSPQCAVDWHCGLPHYSSLPADFLMASHSVHFMICFEYFLLWVLG